MCVCACVCVCMCVCVHVCVCCVCAYVCVCVCLRVCAVTHLPLHMHISGDGGVVLVGLEQEPHRAQDWSELSVVRHMQPHLIVLFHGVVACKKSCISFTKPQCL